MKQILHVATLLIANHSLGLSRIQVALPPVLRFFDYGTLEHRTGTYISQIQIPERPTLILPQTQTCRMWQYPSPQPTRLE